MKRTAWIFLIGFLYFNATFAAGKQPVTPEVAAAPPAGHRMENITWAPDGQRFAYLKDDSIFLYDIATRKSRRIVNRKVLEMQAVEPPEAARFDWEIGRAHV